MRINVNSLETLVKYVETAVPRKTKLFSGVKSILQTKPSAIAELKLKPLAEDLFQISSLPNTYEVKVFNSLSGVLKKSEKLISPEFNGCHGVAVYTSKGNFSFHHFPPFNKEKLATNLESSIQNLPSNCSPHIVFISPVSKNGLRERAFDEYEQIIKARFSKYTSKYYDYPNRTS